MLFIPFLYIGTLEHEYVSRGGLNIHGLPGYSSLGKHVHYREHTSTLFTVHLKILFHNLQYFSIRLNERRLGQLEHLHPPSTFQNSLLKFPTKHSRSVQY